MLVDNEGFGHLLWAESAPGGYCRQQHPRPVLGGDENQQYKTQGRDEDRCLVSVVLHLPRAEQGVEDSVSREARNRE